MRTMRGVWVRGMRISKCLRHSDTKRLISGIQSSDMSAGVTEKFRESCIYNFERYIFEKANNGRSAYGEKKKKSLAGGSRPFIRGGCLHQ